MSVGAGIRVGVREGRGNLVGCEVGGPDIGLQAERSRNNNENRANPYFTCIFDNFTGLLIFPIIIKLRLLGSQNQLKGMISRDWANTEM